MTVLEKATNRGITQAWLIVQLRDRGITISAGDMSRTLHGIMVTPKAMRVLEECEDIIRAYDSAH